MKGCLHTNCPLHPVPTTRAVPAIDAGRSARYQCSMTYRSDASSPSILTADRCAGRARLDRKLTRSSVARIDPGISDVERLARTDHRAGEAVPAHRDHNHREPPWPHRQAGGEQAMLGNRGRANFLVGPNFDLTGMIDGRQLHMIEVSDFPQLFRHTQLDRIGTRHYQFARQQ